MFEDARAHCHVLSTDATGAAIQPEQGAPGGRKQACKKGHFFTIVADCDHVLYHYASSHSSNAVKELFAGFSGFLQSDASAVYDILERGPPKTTDDGLTLVGCWAHCRRYFFDAAVTKHAGAVEGLRRMQEIYRAAEPFAKLPPIQRKDARAKALGPLIDDFFVWVAERRRNEPGRTLFTRALGYATNQEAELRRVLSDGRLALDNTRSERALRTIVVGRKNWLFYGSDVHAQAAAAIFTLVASCRLHRLDPLDYLTALLRVLPYWPDDRYIELAPKSWAATRALLDDAELELPLGDITVPPPANA
jgi:transposase